MRSAVSFDSRVFTSLQVEPGTRGSVEKVLSFILEAGYWYAVEDELDDLYDEVSDGMDDFYDIEVREDI
jgi:hypothetical protein